MTGSGVRGIFLQRVGDLEDGEDDFQCDTCEEHIDHKEDWGDEDGDETSEQAGGKASDDRADGDQTCGDNTDDVKPPDHLGSNGGGEGEVEEEIQQRVGR